jgi:hypothetical protein
MGEYVAEGILPVIPDNLTVPQFILDSSHSTRPIRKEVIPWLVDDTTGHRIGFEEVSDRLMNVMIDVIDVPQPDSQSCVWTCQRSQYQVEDW